MQTNNNGNTNGSENGNNITNFPDQKSAPQPLNPHSAPVQLFHAASVSNLTALEQQKVTPPIHSEAEAGEIFTGKDRVLDFLQKVAKKKPTEFAEVKGADGLPTLELRDVVISDAITLHTFITPSTTIVRDEKGKITESPYQLDAKNLPDAFFVFGNNDLKVMDNVAKRYFECKKHGKAPIIFVSGLGGHATASGHIFGKSEAETIQHRLLALGVPKEAIIIETKAKNSGQNVEFTDAIMKSMTNHQFDHILIFGSPTNVGRQIRTYEQQSTYPWKRISTQSPTVAEIKHTYYQNKKNAAINMIAILCEIGKFLSYTLNDNYMSARAVINEDQLKAAAKIFFEYYKILRQRNIDSDKLTNSFIANYHESIRSRATAKTPDAIAAELTMRRSTPTAKLIKQLDIEFRAIFQIMEYQWVPKLPAGLTMWEQDQCMQRRRFAKMGADTPTPRHSRPLSPR